jgi:two-component system phosphate regulon sensor histidine kinase PhoR
MLGRPREALLGELIWAAFPLAAEEPIHAVLHQAMVGGITTTCTVFFPPRDAWLECRAFPSTSGLSLLCRDVTDQKRAEESMAALLTDVQAANRELTQLNAAKSDFISTTSHEFRTPLTSIQGFSELIISEVTTLDEAQAFARTINENALRLARLIGDMLDLDRLESGQLVPAMGCLSLNDLVQRVLTDLRPTTRRHSLVAQLDPALPQVQCDPDLMIRVLTNLVGNAVKYSPAGGTVTVRTAPHGDGVKLTVADEGLGVPPDHRELIFARYGRITRPEQAGIAGTGLGLPIARHILEVHNGRIWVEANTPVGSVFHVVLPAAAAPAAPSPSAPQAMALPELIRPPSTRSAGSGTGSARSPSWRWR